MWVWGWRVVCAWGERERRVSSLKKSKKAESRPIERHCYRFFEKKWFLMSGRAGRWRNLENDPSSWPGLARPHAPHSTAGGWLRSVHAEHAHSFSSFASFLASFSGRCCTCIGIGSSCVLCSGSSTLSLFCGAS